MVNALPPLANSHLALGSGWGTHWLRAVPASRDGARKRPPHRGCHPAVKPSCADLSSCPSSSLDTPPPRSSSFVARGSRAARRLRCPPDEAELRRQARDQAGAWSRGDARGKARRPAGAALPAAGDLGGCELWQNQVSAGQRRRALPPQPLHFLAAHRRSHALLRHRQPLRLHGQAHPHQYAAPRPRHAQ